MNTDKIHKNADKTKNLDLVVLNKKNNLYHEIDCEYARNIQKYELIKRPLFHFRKHPASCCHDVKSHHKEYKHKPYKKQVIADAEESAIFVYGTNSMALKKEDWNSASELSAVFVSKRNTNVDVTNLY